jgi:hypothetical protein
VDRLMHILVVLELSKPSHCGGVAVA